ncbi:MAG: anaerobic ribonucleoside-triphosphate reductase activating protein [Clostridia bacterium]|nr:anaerobic ribonucleoside-triphosphate reductase activating protein [Clostridia bacterium]
MKIRLSGVIKQSVVDGPGIRFVIFSQGCFHNCKNCHNPQTHDINGGYITDTDNIINEIKKNPLISGVTFSGGEPFLQAYEFSYLAREIHKLGLNIITYTGYTIEELLCLKDKKDIYNLLCETDLLVDGKFDEEKKSLMIKFRGSTNQRIINSRRTLSENKVVELDDFIFEENA